MIYFHCPAGWFAVRTFVLLLTVFAVSTLTTAAEVGSGEAVPATPRRWLLVDTGLLTLSVMEGSEAIYHVQNIAIGSNGTGNHHNKRLRDEKTPLGDFTITAIRPSNRFHLFVGFDYPTMSYADAAVADGRISQEEYAALQSAWHQNLPIPQSTGLGGYFGIHGVGAGNARIHRLFNWTNGCIALTNQQIEQLARLITVGTPVSIR
nr:L,D-transpeptidase [Aestuariicella hydrocarbonica]